VNKADRDRARIAQLRRLARSAQGRDPDESGRDDGQPIRRWQSDAGTIRFVKVGPGTPVLGLEEAASRLKWATGSLEAKITAGDVESVRVGWTRMVPLSEVERMERAVAKER